MEYKNNMFYIYNKRENIISCIKGKSKFVEWLNKKADNFTYQFPKIQTIRNLVM